MAWLPFFLALFLCSAAGKKVTFNEVYNQMRDLVDDGELHGANGLLDSNSILELVASILVA